MLNQPCFCTDPAACTSCPNARPLCIYPQPAERRVCATCHAQMVNVGRDVWMCPTQATEPKGISEARRQSIRAMVAERVDYAPF